MHALVTAAIYFGTFLAIGYGARRLLDRYMARSGTSLDEMHSQDKGRGSQQRFLLGGWYRDR